MNDEKKSKVGYYIVAAIAAIGITVGIISRINYNKRKKLQQQQAQIDAANAKQNFIIGIIRGIKDKGLNLINDDSVLIKALNKLSDDDLNKIAGYLKGEKIDSAAKSEIFMIVAKVLSTDNTINTQKFAASGEEKQKMVVKAADGSGKAKLYKIADNKVVLKQRVMHDGNPVKVNQTISLESVTYFNIFNNNWIKSTDVVTTK